MSELSGRSGIAPPLPEHPTRARMRKSRGRLAHIDRRAHITRRSLEPAFSAVLSVSLTAPSRSSSAMTSGLPVAAPRTASQGGDGALPVPVQEAYVNARVLDDAGWYGCSRYRIRPCCLLLPRRHRHPGLHCFRRSQPGLHTPLSTLRVTPRGATCMTRGRCGSLPLHRSGLSPPTSCRSPGAPWLNPTPQMITVYASPWSSPSPTQHSLPGGRYPLPGPDFHRLDRASFAWRTADAFRRKTRPALPDGHFLPVWMAKRRSDSYYRAAPA